MAPYQQLNLSGQLFEYIIYENQPILLQRLSGQTVRLYRSIDLADPVFFLMHDKDVQEITPERLNVQLGKQLAACPSLANAMAYTKVKYKAVTLVHLLQQYAECIGEPHPLWTRADSLEINLAAGMFRASARVGDQPFKDHSGEFRDVQYQGWGVSMTAFANRRVRLIAGLNSYELQTTNPLANVHPANDPSYYASVRYRWSGLMIPVSVAYNVHLDHWRGYIGLGGTMAITRNLIVSETFHAPFLPDPATVTTRLNVNSHFGVQGILGIERLLGRRWVVGIQYELQKSQLDFNLVRIERNLAQLPPILATYRISSPELFATASDMTKLRFTTNQINLSIKFRLFWNYTTFN